MTRRFDTRDGIDVYFTAEIGGSLIGQAVLRSIKVKIGTYSDTGRFVIGDVPSHRIHRAGTTTERLGGPLT